MGGDPWGKSSAQITLITLSSVSKNMINTEIAFNLLNDSFMSRIKVNYFLFVYDNGIL